MKNAAAVSLGKKSWKKRNTAEGRAHMKRIASDGAKALWAKRRKLDKEAKTSRV